LAIFGHHHFFFLLPGQEPARGMVTVINQLEILRLL
ncbi:MAG: hypothetical protein ACD_39C01998G0003, partial [uncultured bacterium]